MAQPGANITTAYERGRQAAREGRLSVVCPYSLSRPRMRMAFLEGWASVVDSQLCEERAAVAAGVEECRA